MLARDISAPDAPTRGGLQPTKRLAPDAPEERKAFSTPFLGSTCDTKEVWSPVVAANPTAVAALPLAAQSRQPTEEGMRVVGYSSTPRPSLLTGSTHVFPSRSTTAGGILHPGRVCAEPAKIEHCVPSKRGNTQCC